LLSYYVVYFLNFGEKSRWPLVIHGHSLCKYVTDNISILKGSTFNDSYFDILRKRTATSGKRQLF
jgi:hypothetical protein